MGFVTKEQIERARQIPVLDYVMRYEADQFKSVGNGLRLRSDNALAVSNDGWYCHKRNSRRTGNPQEEGALPAPGPAGPSREGVFWDHWPTEPGA